MKRSCLGTLPTATKVEYELPELKGILEETAELPFRVQAQLSIRARHNGSLDWSRSGGGN